MDQQNKYILIGVVAGAALGLIQLPAQGYDFSGTADVSQAIGFMLGFVGLGALIGWISGRSRSELD